MSFFYTYFHILARMVRCVREYTILKHQFGG